MLVSGCCTPGSTAAKASKTLLVIGCFLFDQLGNYSDSDHDRFSHRSEIFTTLSTVIGVSGVIDDKF